MLRSVVAVLALALPPVLHAGTILNFEGFPDSTILTNQYLGVTFSNAIILTAGISLNEFEFPPHSEVNVVSDNGGPMSITFSSPVESFGGYFTYAEALTIQAFNVSNLEIASAVPHFLTMRLSQEIPAAVPTSSLG